MVQVLYLDEICRKETKVGSITFLLGLFVVTQDGIKHEKALHHSLNSASEVLKYIALSGLYFRWLIISAHCGLVPAFYLYCSFEVVEGHNSHTKAQDW